MISLPVFAVIGLMLFVYFDKCLVYFGLVKELNWSKRNKFLDLSFTVCLYVVLLVVAVVF